MLLGLLAFAVMGTGLALAARAHRDEVLAWWGQRQAVERARRESAHPIVAELTDGTVQAGGPLEALIARHPPSLLVRHGPYTTILYAEGARETHLAARNGRLLWAGQGGEGVAPCTFFSTWTREEERAYSVSYQRAREDAIGE